MADEPNGLLARVEILERQLKEMTTRLNEPLQAGNARRIRSFLDSATCKNVTIQGKAHFHQPVLFSGEGKITIGDDVHFGYSPASALYGGYIFIQAILPFSHISIGSHVCINNNSLLASEGEGIEIGESTIMGTYTQIFDSNFHDLDPTKRRNIDPHPRKTIIGKNVFIGASCMILKGVLIGDDSVIGGGSVVTKDVPERTVAAGNPAKIIRQL